MPVPDCPVVYIIIDGLSTTAFEQAISSGVAPALGFIRQAGHYVRDSVAIFPTITPAATASLVTGETPARHGVPGMCWYDRDARRFVNYGQSPRAAVLEGVSQVVEDVLHNLNEHHLRKDVSTIHERMDDLGFTTASINYMVFRGPYEKQVDAGGLLDRLLGKRLPERISGPKEHYFADVVSGSVDGPCSELISKRGLQERTKATDAWAACVTRDLLERRAADMILFYLHENDHLSHRNGPAGQVENLETADEHVAYVLDAFASWDEAVERVGFVVTADHSQSPVSDEDDHILALEDILDDFEQVDPGRGKDPFDGAELACAGNGRVGFIYADPARAGKVRDRVVRTLAEHEGIDQIMWRQEDSYVVDSDRGRVRFHPSQGDGVVDERGNKWTYEGDLEAVGGVVEEDEMRSPEYPLAFWRIQQALDLDRVGDVVVTPKLTYELKDLAGADHKGGGDHASLHVQDSIVPFLSTLEEPPLLPSTVDVMDHILSHFARRRAG